MPAVDGAEVAALVRPIVPDRDTVIAQVLDVGVAGQEPEKLVDDRLHVQLLGGDERKAFGEIEAHLVTEHRQRAGSGAVALLGSGREDSVHQIKVLAHEPPWTVQPSRMTRD